jgi:GAF domain-containing protein
MTQLYERIRTLESERKALQQRIDAGGADVLRLQAEVDTADCRCEEQFREAESR